MSCPPRGHPSLIPTFSVLQSTAYLLTFSTSAAFKLMAKMTQVVTSLASTLKVYQTLALLP